MLKPMAVKMQYRKKKFWILDTLYDELDSPDPETLPLDNHLSGSNQFQSVFTQRKLAPSLKQDDMKHAYIYQICTVFILA